MASANGFKALEAGTYSYLNGADLSNEKLAIEDFRTKGNIIPEAPRSASNFNKMASVRYLVMTLALLSVFIVSLSSAAAVRPKDCHGQTAEEIKFQELLATVSDDALHKVLEEYVSSKYKPGVWREGRTAMSAVHKDDAAKATSLIQLARRQNVSMTTDAETATPSETTIVVPPATTDAEPSTTADPESTTSDEPTPSGTATEPTQDPTVSETFSDVPPVTSSTAVPTEAETESSITEAEPSQTSDPPVSSETQEASSYEPSEKTTTSSTDAPSTSQTSAEPTAIPTSPSESVSPTSEPTTTETSTEAESTSTTVQTTTTRPSSMTTSRATTVRSTTSDEDTTTTSEEIESSATQEVVFTTVKPDGSRSTITSYTVVPAAEATQDAPADPTFTPEVQDAATSLSGAGILGFAIVGLTAFMAAL